MFELTPEDIKHLCKIRYWYSDNLTAYQRNEICSIQTQVAEFVGWSGLDEPQQPPGHRSDLVAWLEVGLALLSDDRYNKDPNLQFPNHVQEAFETQVAEVSESGSVGHPWDDDILDACRRWLTATPYRVWRFYQDVQGAAQDALEEVLLDIVSEGRHDLKRAVEEAVDRVKSKFVKQYQGAK